MLPSVRDFGPIFLSHSRSGDNPSFAAAGLVTGCARVSSIRPLSHGDHTDCYFSGTQMPCKPDVQKQTKNAERAEAFLVSVSGLNVSPKRLLENRFIKFSFSQ